MTEDNIAPITSVKVVTDKCTYKDNELLTKYSYENAVVTKTASGRFDVTPTVQDYVFKLDLKKPEKLGIMLIGLGGNNGSTLVASVLANKHNVEFPTILFVSNIHFTFLQ